MFYFSSRFLSNSLRFYGVGRGKSKLTQKEELWSHL